MRSSAVILVLGMICSVSASAVNIVSFDFSGTLADAYGSTAPGASIEGTLQYDADVPPSSVGGPFNPNRYPAESLLIMLSIGGEAVTATGGGIPLEVGNDSEFGAGPGETVDAFNVVSAAFAGSTISGTVGGLNVGWVQLTFVDPTATMFDDKSLPTTGDFLLADTSELKLAEFDIAFGGVISPIGPATSSVPAPGPLALLALALIIVAIARGRRLHTL